MDGRLYLQGIRAIGVDTIAAEAGTSPAMTYGEACVRRLS
jgi:AcrR family transcriptional regulator